MNQPVRLRADTRARFSAAEFLHMVRAGAFDDIKVELVEGELERRGPPMGGHAAGQASVVIRLAAVLGESLVCGEVGVVLSEDTVVGCDAAVLRAPTVERSFLEPADLVLVVEVAETTLARDLGTKRALYAAAGVAIYWVVDGARDVVHVFSEPVDGEYASVATVRFGAPLAVPGTLSHIVLG